MNMVVCFNIYFLTITKIVIIVSYFSDLTYANDGNYINIFILYFGTLMYLIYISIYYA